MAIQSITSPVKPDGTPWRHVKIAGRPGTARARLMARWDPDRTRPVRVSVSNGARSEAVLQARVARDWAKQAARPRPDKPTGSVRPQSAPKPPVPPHWSIGPTKPRTSP